MRAIWLSETASIRRVTAPGLTGSTRGATPLMRAACVKIVLPLRTYELRTSIAVSDIQKAVAFYEGKLGLQPLESGPSAHIADGSRVYGSGCRPALNVYLSDTAGKTPATVATW